MSECMLPNDKDAVELERELLTARVTTSYINFVDPILYNSLYEGFHVYYSASITLQKMKDIAKYVKSRYNFDAHINPMGKYCRFYRPKLGVTSDT